MMTFGGLLSVLAAWRYHVVNRDIERGKVKADHGLVILITVAMAVLSGAMIAFVLLTAGSHNSRGEFQCRYTRAV